MGAETPWWIFFDLDGTLADSLPGLHASIEEAFLSVGRSMPLIDLRAYIGPGIRTILYNLDSTLTQQEIDRMEQIFRSSYDSRGVLSTECFPEAEETLRTLKSRGHRLYIVTNKPKLATMNLLEKWAFGQLFEDVVCRNSREPHFASKAEMLMETMKKHGAEPTRSIMVGDTDEDHVAALEAGARFFHASYGYGKIEHTSCEAIEAVHHLLTQLEGTRA